MPRITELWAWVVADEGPDDEGIPAYFDPVARMMLPMVGADRARAESLREIAVGMSIDLGKPLRLVRSTGLETVDTVEP